MRWQEAARGIPVWAGAFFFEDETRRWPIRRMCTDVTEPPTYPKRSTWAAPAEYDSSRCYPDLTNPDTRAAYIRRLAVALGCPESTADIGVTFQASGDGYECAAGRKITMEGGTFTPWRWHSGGNPRFAVADERVALALAWPADKRVTT